MGSNIEYPGVIFQINGDVVQVKILQKTACADCHAKSMCSLSEVQEKILEISDQNHDFKEGDEVLVTGAVALGMKAVLLAFVFPLLIMVIILAFGIRFFMSEIIAAGVAVLSLIIYYVILYFRRDDLKKKFVFTLKKR